MSQKLQKSKQISKSFFIEKAANAVDERPEKTTKNEGGIPETGRSSSKKVAGRMNGTIEHSTTLQRNLDLLVQTGLLLAKQCDLQTTVQSATDAGLLLCKAQFGAFFYNAINATGEGYALYVLSGAEREQFSRFIMPGNTAVFGPTFEGLGIVRSGDITKDARYGQNPSYDRLPLGHLPVRSYLAVPVKAQSGEVLGGMFYGHEDADVFEQDTEELMATVAAQVANAIENFRLREQLTQKIEDLQKAELLQRYTAKTASEVAAIVEFSDDAILSKDLNGQITSWNQSASRILGYSHEEIVGKSILQLIPDELRFEEKTILDMIRAGKRIDHFETVRLTKSGERLDVSLSISPIKDASGTIVGASKILRDISGKKRMEASLIQAEKIAAAGRMAATIAHEINNPLEAVMNLLFLAKSNISSREEARSFIELAESEIVRVSHIAKQSLGFYREHASPVSSSISCLAAEAVRIYEPKCNAARIHIYKNLNSTQQIVLRKGEILQVISNLIANAISAMPSGGMLSVSTEDAKDPDGSGVIMIIQDNGVGIPAEQLPSIFEAFFTTRNSIGTGIGLFVVKQFIKGHGGKIEVQSSIDPASHGTKITIFLPAETPYSLNGKFEASHEISSPPVAP